MHHFRHLGCALAVTFLSAACGDSGNGGDKASDQSKLKQEARARFANGDQPVSNDPCAENAWYDDGECDAWCPKGDGRDCNDDDEVVCALFFTEPDGKCDKNDPCGPVQDPDCQDDGDGDHADGGIACIEIQYPTNGKCEAAKGCEYTDAEDCGDDGDGLVCPAIWSPADGKCDESDPCGPATDEDCQGQTEPGDPGNGVSCIEIAYATNGKCEAAPGCEYTDPKDCDGSLVCPTIYIPKDGKCPANDPCDPDC